MPWLSETSAMVDGKFLASHPTAFAVTKLHTWMGAVLAVRNSATGAAVMEVETVEVGYRNLRALVLLDAASRRPLLTVEEVGTNRRRWQAIRGGGASRGNRVFVAIDRTGFFETGVLVDVFLEGNSTAHPDYVVHGSYFKGAMTVSRGGGGGEDVAQIGKEDGSKSSVLSGEHTYHVNIDPDVDQALVLALTVIVDQRHNYDFESSSCSCNHSSHHASRSTGSRSHH
ncbi:uncharacterized protein [Aegilops tauschii subsp. strangulata]|uniref:Uncharacterized protein n=1 Tax=Aegilops tauschii subsp. strangulata TaxID=200361 RepID=A0A453M827_AEGTS|nr:uncharacterized protein LOC109774944 [Aegilops tauschii subsp. strangulata]